MDSRQRHAGMTLIGYDAGGQGKGVLCVVLYWQDAMSEIGAFFKKTGKSIVAFTVKDILEEQIAYKLA